MSVESLSHVWSATGLTAEEKLMLIFIANADAGLGYPHCIDPAGMADFIGCTLDDTISILGALADKGLVQWNPQAEDESSHCIWISYDGTYHPPIDWTAETKSRSKRVAALIERDGHGCQYCGATPATYHVDHFVPRCLGGPDKLSNLVLACSPCNLAKSGKAPDVFLADRPALLRSLLCVLGDHDE